MDYSTNYLFCIHIHSCLCCKDHSTILSPHNAPVVGHIAHFAVVHHHSDHANYDSVHGRIQYHLTRSILHDVCLYVHSHHSWYMGCNCIIQYVPVEVLWIHLFPSRILSCKWNKLSWENIINIKSDYRSFI